MSPIILAESYSDSEMIVDRRMIMTIDCYPVWQKLYRVKQYLREQAQVELAEVLK